MKRVKDGKQAAVVASLVAAYMPHLAYVSDDLRMLPRAVFEDARHLFTPDEPADSAFGP